MSLKTSTCVLFKPDQTFHSFGYEAEDHYGELASEETGEHKKWYYFRRFKMQLFDKTVSIINQMIMLGWGRVVFVLSYYNYAILGIYMHMPARVSLILISLGLYSILTIVLFYYRANKPNNAALLTRCYVQHFFSPYIDCFYQNLHKRDDFDFEIVNF